MSESPRVIADPIYKPLYTRQIGHLPFKSVMKVDLNGGHLATTTVEGKQYIGSGDTPRKASFDLNRQVDEATKVNNTRTPTKGK